MLLIVQHFRWEWLSWGDPFISGGNSPYFSAYYFITNLVISVVDVVFTYNEYNCVLLPKRERERFLSIFL